MASGGETGGGTGGVMGAVIAVLVGLGLLVFLLAEYFDRDAPPETSNAKHVVAFLERLREISPVLLGIVWIAYGLLHLVYPDSAMKQMPEWLGPAREPLWAASGSFEIALGMLVVGRRWRRVSLLAQLVMLIALAPFVVFLVHTDSGLADVLPGIPASLARVVLVFHNLLLFVWVYGQFRRGQPGRAPLDVGTDRNPPPVASLVPFKWSPVLTVSLVLLAANVAGVAVVAAAPWHGGVLLVWAMACIAGGALIGFLFGVPRWVSSKEGAEGKTERYVPNTNIEKVSDWLTTVLVGVSLVELPALGGALFRAAEALARGLTVRPGRDVGAFEAQAFATGLIAYFVAAGIIQGFLLTRMFLTRAWQGTTG